MYRLRSRLALALALAFIGNCAHAERLQPGSPLSGYQCYHIDAEALKLTPEDAWEGKGFPPVFKGPSEDSGKLGVASGLVYVAWPLQKDNGFVRILRFDGRDCVDFGVCDQAIYIETQDRKGAALCRGMAIEFSSHLDPGAKGWLFRDGHDIPEDKIRR